jgi:hypothetical protein
MVNLGQIRVGKRVNILDDFAGLPGSGGVMAADGRAIGLALNKTIGGAEVDEDGVAGGEGGGGLPVEQDFGLRVWGRNYIYGK